MKIRATIVVAMLAIVLGLSLGAQAGDLFKLEVPLDMTAVDTSAYVVGAKVNDTIGPWTATFGMSHEYSAMVGRILQVTADTSTATGFVYDSVYFKLETKMDHDSDLTWYTLWTSSLFPSASFDTSGGWADGEATRISIPVDSMPSIGDLFRLRVYLVAEEDSMRAAGYSSSTIDPMMSYIAYLLFRLK